ncbi:ubiquitin specific protease 16/45 isoform X2 [Calliopsis andreniformis]|uniref:ubiquitin specific protease 16/45 isoform X2 n=1 Tax=Calliopsis andreniformis TaxID=337506 RepID=UPI003FCC3078
MSKKRTRQPDPTGDIIEDSTDSCDESNSTGRTCSHITKAVNFNKLRKYVNKPEFITECIVCKKNETNAPRINEQESAINSTTLICLQCGHQGCGKKEQGHALEHYKKPHSDCHFIILDTHNWSVWCYQCELYINSGCRKMLQDTVEFVKKTVTLKHNSPPTSMILTQGQEEAVNINIQKEKVLHKLPKVGGLMNLGNTCFFNAVLQCLAQTPFLVDILDKLRLPGQKFILPGGNHKLPNSTEEVELPPIEGTLEGWGNFTSILHKTLVEMQNSDGHQCYRPSELLNSFKKKTMQCMDGGQHDSHELLRHLLEIVRNEDLRRYQSIILKKVGLNEKTNPDGVENSLKSRVKFYGNQAAARLLGAELVFCGVLVSTLECLECHHSSQTMEPFLDLSLPVVTDKPQPPFLKKQQNAGSVYFFKFVPDDLHTPSKHQLRTEKKVAQKNRNGPQEISDNDDSVIPNKSNVPIWEFYNTLKSEESDADVEDNIEIEPLLPEIGESGYSSKRQSAALSPASPSTYPVAPDELKFKITYMDLLNSFHLNSLASPTGPSKKNISDTKVIDRLDNSESPENEHGIQTRSSLSTSLAMNSDLTSPEGPTVSLTSVAFKESPIKSAPSLTNGKSLDKVKKSMARVNSIESISHNDQENTLDHSVVHSKHERRKTIINCSNDEWNQCNGINGTTSGISKMGNHGQPSPTRYVTKEGECSIQSCLNQFTALELMSASNEVTCESCVARANKMGNPIKVIRTPSTKQYLISRVPPVLILHLKRFQAQQVDFRKVTKHISFSMLLDLTPICKNHKKSKMYALYGIVEHSGTIYGGHYVAYVKSRVPLASNDPRWSFLPSKGDKHKDDDSSSSCSESDTEEAAANSSSTVEPPPGKWYYVSDSRVSEVDETTVLQSQAYLLFYERIR